MLDDYDWVSEGIRYFKFYSMRGNYDILWKGMLEEVFEDLLRFVDPGIDKNLDFDHGVEFLDKELAEMYPEPEKKSSTRIVDKLVKVHLRGGDERWMLLHVIVSLGNELIRKQVKKILWVSLNNWRK